LEDVKGKKMSEAFRLGVKPPSELAPPDWMTENVSLFNSERGKKFDINQSLWLREPLMQLKNYDTKQVVLYGPTGVGKSAMAEAMFAWVVAESPGPLLYLSQTNDTSRIWKESRLSYALKSVPRVRDLWPKDRHKDRKGDIIFPHMPMHIRGANKSSCQELSMQYLYGDEVWTWKPDLMQEFLGRHHNRWNRKVFLVSQAGLVDDSMDRAFEETDKNEWSFECDGCGDMVQYHRKILKYDIIKVEGSIDDQATADTARIECPKCGHIYPDQIRVRRDMHKKSRYVPTSDKGLKGHKGYRMHRLGVWHTSWASYVLKELKAKKQLNLGVVDLWRQTHQKDDCQPWKDDLGMKRKEMRLSDTKLKDRDPKAKMKNETDRFMSCDKGGDHFWVVVRAWAKGEGSELLFAGYVPENKDAQELRSLQEKYAVEDRKTLIDIQFDSDKIASWCQRYGWTGIRGNGVVTSYKHKIRGGATVEKSYSAPKIKEGKTLVARAIYFEVASNPIKDILWRLMNGEGINWTVPEDVSKAYKRHMKSEVRKEKDNGKQVWEAADRQNHLWDAEYYNVAAALMNGIFED